MYLLIQFEIHSPSSHVFYLQADSAEDRTIWCRTIQAHIERLLKAGVAPPSATTTTTARGVVKHMSRDSAAAAQKASLREAAERAECDAVKAAIMESSPRCADCSQSAPEWVSLNCGILACIECAGVHRELGVDVSQIRSLALDTIAIESLETVRELGGNDRCNAVWMAHQQPGWEHLTPDAGRKARTKFIEAKYRWRAFTAPMAAGQDSERMMIDAAVAGDIDAVLRALVTGMDMKTDAMSGAWAGFKRKRMTFFLLENVCVCTLFTSPCADLSLSVSFSFSVSFSVSFFVSFLASRTVQ